MLRDTFSRREVDTIRTLAIELCSACACEAVRQVSVTFIGSVAIVLFKDADSKVYAEEAIALVGAAWMHTELQGGYEDLNESERYAECEALIREGWEPKDDE